MTAPAWASDLVAAVCADADVQPPRLIWRIRRASPSTGVARRSDGTISVRAGTDTLDQRLTLLHELAHWIAPAARRRGRRSVHHGRAFYAAAFDLYRRHGLDDADALRLESPPTRSLSIGRGSGRDRVVGGVCSSPSTRSGWSATGAGPCAPSAASVSSG
jgi:hypothetical protein